ncbi:MAG: hypothetical protein HYY96_06930 [Candidatus Tectomicrobia bacterium]|nr:hypothetical protein [Candidatus Tectomicrobia bacterium]
MIVGIMGNDGTGKTTLVEELARCCEEAGISVVIRRGFDHPLLAALLRRCPSQRLSEGRRRYLDPGAPRRFWMRLWPFAVCLECLIVTCWERLTARDRLILYDRTPFDHLVSFEHLGCSSAMVRRLFLRLPRPHLLILLEAPPRLACRRKGENPRLHLPYHRAQQQRYAELAAALRLRPLPTDRDQAAVTLDAWRRIAARWPATFGFLPRPAAGNLSGSVLL